MRRASRFLVRPFAAAAALGVAAGICLPARPNPGADDPRRAAVNRSPEADAAVARALRFLAARQNPDGSFGRWFGLADVSVATTSLCGLAFLAQGNAPGRGPYGNQVRLAAGYLLACQKQSEQGYITEPAYGGGSRMHGNGFAVLFLAELLGMSHDSRDGPAIEGLEEAVRRAVKVIERYQTPEGGWNNEPSAIREEGSVTVTQCQALRAARNAGIKIGRGTVNGAVRFLRHCADTDGGIRYNLSTWRTTYALTGAGVSALCFLGEYDLPEVRRGVQYMTAVLDEEDRSGWTHRRGSHRSYETFYATQALYQAGGPAWARYWPRLRAEILARQETDGSWEDPYCAEMGTAFHTLALEVPSQYLPIFQR
jgi:hypothetical protein